MTKKWNGKLPTIEERRKGAMIAWQSDMQKMLNGAIKGGQMTGSKINTCPNCGREIKGNSGFGMHTRKCKQVVDK